MGTEGVVQPLNVSGSIYPVNKYSRYSVSCHHILSSPYFPSSHLRSTSHPVTSTAPHIQLRSPQRVYVQLLPQRRPTSNHHISRLKSYSLSNSKPLPSVVTDAWSIYLIGALGMQPFIKPWGHTYLIGRHSSLFCLITVFYHVFSSMLRFHCIIKWMTRQIDRFTHCNSQKVKTWLASTNCFASDSYTAT